MCTVRHPAERDWPKRRKALSPTLEDLVPKLIARQEGWPAATLLPRLRIVQRLDKETSGLVVFARSVLAERGLGKQFHAHTVTRRYLAIVPGLVTPQRIGGAIPSRHITPTIAEWKLVSAAEVEDIPNIEGSKSIIGFDS